MADWYPVLLNLQGRKCVIVGGGSVAQRKAEGLLAANADVAVISPAVTPYLRQLAEAGKLRWLEKTGAAEDLDGAALVFAATDQPGVNRALAEEAGRRGIFANIADDGQTGGFITPAVLKRGELVLAVSTSGGGPALAKKILRELADRYGTEYKAYVEALRTIRQAVKSGVDDQRERALLLEAAVTEDALEEWREADWLQDSARVIARLRQLAE